MAFALAGDRAATQDDVRAWSVRS